MKWLVCGLVTAALVVGAPAHAGDVEFRPIDTEKLVVQPSKTAANLAAGTINLVGRTTASAVEGNGWTKLVNHVLSIKRTEPKFQTNGLPSPNTFKSTQYKSYNTPVMPTVQYMPQR